MINIAEATLYFILLKQLDQTFYIRTVEFIDLVGARIFHLVYIDGAADWKDGNRLSIGYIYCVINTCPYPNREHYSQMYSRTCLSEHLS